jgi:hypothetical protein
MSASRNARWRRTGGASTDRAAFRPGPGVSMSNIGGIELLIIIVIAIVVAALVLREIGTRGRR